MRKKILIIGSICLVLILVIMIVKECIIVVEKPMGKKGVVVFPSKNLLNITGLPTKIANVVLPPLNLKNKSDEERKEIVIRLIKEATEASYNYQLLKTLELDIKIIRIGTPLVPVLLDIFRDKATEETTVMYAGQNIKGGVIRSGALDTLEEIIKAKIVPLEKRLQEEGGDIDPVYRSYLKRYYKYANRIEIDIEKVVSELIEIFEEALPDKDDFVIECIADFFKEVKDKRGIEVLIKGFNSRDEEVRKRVIERQRRDHILDDIDRPKRRIKEALLVILKETHDRRIAEALDKGGIDYGVWIWVDETGRGKAINIAMEVLKGNYMPKLSSFDEEEIKLGAEMMRWLSIEEIRKEEIKIKAIEVLGEAKAKEAVPMLLELLEREKDHSVRENIIISLGKIKDKRAVEPLINLARKRFSPPPPEGYDGEVIEALGEIGDERAVEILEELLEHEGEFMRKYVIEALKKITGKEYKYKR